MRILGDGNFRDEALLLAVEVDEDEESKDEEAGDAVPAEGSSSTVVGDKHAANDGAAATTQSVMDALEDTLSRGSQMLGSVVGNVRAGCSPYGCMGDALHQLEWQHHPRIGQIGNV